jgi:hypothetical protein
MIAAQLARLLGAETGFRGSVTGVFKKLGEANPAYAAVTYPRLAKEGAVQVERRQASASRDALVSGLSKAAAAVDRAASRDDRPVEMGEGLFHIGTIALRSKLLTGAFESGRAKGRPAEEEAALIRHKTV